MDILDINIVITEVVEVEGNENVKMISFHGGCDSEYFKGKVQPGAVDTQKIKKDNTGTVSARYVLKGTDSSNSKCSIYIENNGIINQNGEMITVPKIVTDSRELKWMEEAELSCRFEMRGNDFYVVVMTKEER